MKINREWHDHNRMPENPTLAQRIDWHIEHSKHCACREIPKNLQKIIQKSRQEKVKP